MTVFNWHIFLFLINANLHKVEVAMVEQHERKKTTKWYECPDCGNWFKSTGYQKRVICPHCYERRTGKKLGGNTEKAIQQRKINIAKRQAEKQALAKAQQQQVNNNPEREEKESLIDKFLNFKL